MWLLWAAYNNRIKIIKHVNITIKHNESSAIWIKRWVGKEPEAWDEMGVCYLSYSHLQCGIPVLGHKGNWQSQVFQVRIKRQEASGFLARQKQPIKTMGLSSGNSSVWQSRVIDLKIKVEHNFV